jgi:hypothetical protein
VEGVARLDGVSDQGLGLITWDPFIYTVPKMRFGLGLSIIAHDQVT